MCIAFNICTTTSLLIANNKSDIILPSQEIMQERLKQAGYESFSERTGLIDKLYKSELTEKNIRARIAFACEISKIHSEDTGLLKLVNEQTAKSDKIKIQDDRIKMENELFEIIVQNHTKMPKNPTECKLDFDEDF